MKTLICLLALCTCCLTTMAQAPAIKLYAPDADAKKNIADLLKQAVREKKNVFIMAGGNWCVWCLEFNRFTKADSQIDSLFKADYLVYHLNYSPENKNLPSFAKLGYPQRFGFPVFIILDENGNRIHTQNSAYLEQGRSYNRNKVIEFLKNWNRSAYEPAAYNTK
ncbi:MAG: thioredoxin family protein [Chitinophagaceae bacterium]